MTEIMVNDDTMMKKLFPWEKTKKFSDEQFPFNK